MASKNELKTKKSKGKVEDNYMRWTNDEKLENTEFFVECDSSTFSLLWDKHYYSNSESDRMKWIQDGSGFARHIGNIGNKLRKRTVYITFSFYIINGKYICFYYSDGRYQDWNKIDAYIVKINKKYNRGGSIVCGAGSFHNCLHFCQD